MSKSVAKEIEERLKQLDFDPLLKIEGMPLPFNRWVILADGKSSRPKNPTTYVVNRAKSYDDKIRSPQETFAVMIAARTVRRRSQSGDKKPQPFLSLKLNEGFLSSIEQLIFNTWDEFECDAEIISRIAGEMFERGDSINEIKGILTMDASAIVEKLGMEFIQESMYI